MARPSVAPSLTATAYGFAQLHGFRSFNLLRQPEAAVVGLEIVYDYRHIAAEIAVDIAIDR